MVEVEFEFAQNVLKIQAQLNDLFQSVINQYAQKASINPDLFYFLANGKTINNKETVESQMNEINKRNSKIRVLVFLIEDNRRTSIKSKEIICPKCKEPCRIKFENYKIKLYDCINNHITKNLKIMDFSNTQIINTSNIVCNICKVKNLGNIENNEFYKCLDCKKNLCLLCKLNHDSNHNVISYEQKNYICLNHGEQLAKYCKQCHLNICFLCEEDHINHEIISFSMPNMKDTKNRLLEIKTEIESLKSKVEDIINQMTNRLNEIIKFLDIYYGISNDILNNFEKKNRNYQILENIKEIRVNNEIFGRLKNINKMKNFNELTFNINDLYTKIYNSENIEDINILNNQYSTLSTNLTFDERLNQMNIIYQIDKIDDYMIIFNEIFVENNKNNCYLIIDNQQKELCSLTKLNKKQKKNNTLEIKLIETKTITNMSYMFDSCNSLISLPDISKWDTKDVTDMSYMFYNCNSLELLPDISKWDIRNVINMSYMFSNCSSLKSIPDIDNWQVNKNLKKEKMFEGFKLTKIPRKFADLNLITIIYNVDKKMDSINIFGSDFVRINCNNCYLLIDGKEFKLSEKLKLNQRQKEKNTLEVKLVETSTIIDMSNIFNGCNSLIYLPNIYEWNTKYIKKMAGIFLNCNSLKSFPDISKWDTKNVTNMSYMFYNYNSLKSLPDISKWDTRNVTNMSYMFYNCNSLKSLPDISKWDTKNVTNMSYMFYNCNSLESLPDISKWQFNENLNKLKMFIGCKRELIPENLKKYIPNKMTILYSISEYNNDIYIFNKSFVEKNKSKCYLVIYDVEKDLCSDLKFQKYKNILEIKLIETETITDMSYMFYDCNSLISLPDISKWDIKNVTDMSYMFYNCSSLKSLPDISHWQFNENLNKLKMFIGCKRNLFPENLKKYIPNQITILYNIPKYNNNIYIFNKSFVEKNKSKCYLLIDGVEKDLCSDLKFQKYKNILEIKLIETKTITDMSYMFYDCNSLISLPDISEWDTKNVTDMSHMFYNCRSLESLPDISKWDTKNVTNISYMFYNCRSLQSLPDISKWDINYLTNKIYMFDGCNSLESLPDISKWDIKNTNTNMNYMFYNYNSSEPLHYISK